MLNIENNLKITTGKWWKYNVIYKAMDRNSWNGK